MKIFLFTLVLVFIFNFSVEAILLEKGDRGEKVQRMQEKLLVLGLDLEIDGIFGSETKEKIKHLQREEGLQIDGIVGPQTWQVLKEKVSFDTYIIRPWDTLSEIAYKYEVDKELILKANNQNEQELIQARNEILIPKTSLGGTFEKKNEIIKESQDRVKEEQNQNNDTDFIKPVGDNYDIVSLFGNRVNPFTNSNEFHEGIDIATPTGTKVRAAKSGKVSRSGNLGGFGRTITIDHDNGVISLYAHNSQLLVSEGEKVKQGQKIALSGNTGRSTGPHLHFGIYINNKPVNPLDYIK